VSHEATVRQRLSKSYDQRRADARQMLESGDEFNLEERGFFWMQSRADFERIAATTDDEFAAEDSEALSRAIARDSEERIERIKRRLWDFKIPEKDHERLLAGVSKTASVSAAEAAVDGDLGILVLSGSRGVGKTVAAGHWLLEMAERRNRGGLFLDATQLVRWSRYDEAEMRKIERVGALVIDDLGIEYDDKFGAFRSFVDGLVNARYSARMPTLITTNLPAEDFKRGDQTVEGFKSRYGERVADRIREVGKFFELGGESLRKKARAA
jgi:DNA replication protein DnaC